MTRSLFLVRSALCFVLLAGASTGACARVTVGPPLPSHALRDPSAEALFRGHGVEGAFVLLHAPTQRLWVAGPERAAQRWTPASTFKVPNTLIGLSTGVIPDERFSLKWDGKKRWMKAWNRDHALPSAMQYSVVWFYQELARRIGAERMAQGLARLDYGNRDMGGGLDRFWLDGRIAISPLEQVRFLEKLWAGKLDATAEHQALLRRLLMVYGRDGERVWRGKTGTALRRPENIGWLVGGVDGPGGPWLFALLVLAPSPDMDALMKVRLALGKSLLQHFGAWPR